MNFRSRVMRVYRPSILFKVILLCCLMLAGIGMELCAQILKKDTVKAHTRHSDIYYFTDRYDQELQQVDTSLLHFHRYSAAFRNGEFEHLYLNNNGQASQMQVFEYERPLEMRLGFRQFDRYWWQSDSIPYFQSKYPFSEIRYMLGPEEEQILNANFNRPISEHSQIGFNYHRITSPGRYDNQRTGMNNFAAHFHQTSKNGKRKLLAHYLLNTAKVQQNGGVDSLGRVLFDEEFSVIDTQYFQYYVDTNVVRKEIVPVNMLAAETQAKHWQLLLQNSFDINFGKRQKKKSTSTDSGELDTLMRVTDTLRNTMLIPADKDSIAVVDSSSTTKVKRENLNGSSRTKAPATGERSAKTAPSPPTQSIAPSKPSKFSARLGHVFSYDRRRQQYSNDLAQGDIYEGRFLSSSITNDSMQLNTLRNTVFLQLSAKDAANKIKGNSFSARASFTHKMYWLSQTIDQDTLPTVFITPGDVDEYTSYVDTIYQGIYEANRFQSGVLGFHLRNRSSNGKWRFRANAQYALFGRNIADLKVDGEARFTINEKVGGLKGNLNFQRATQDLMSDFYFGNHHKWDNGLLPKTTALQFGVTYYNPFLRLEAGYRNHTINNYLLYDQSQQPVLADGVVNVSQLVVKHRWTWRKLHLHNTVVLQESSSDQVRLPNIWTKHSFFVHTPVFKRAMLLHMGFDLRYNSNYKANGYSPAIGQFYLQDASTLTFYPMMDVFITAQIKRVRFFINVQHVNQGLFGQSGVLAAPQQPFYDRSLRFGLSWMFFD